MVVPATLKRGAWVGAVVLAAGIIIVLALHGRRPDPGLVRFEAAGVMLRIPPDRVTDVRMSTGSRRWQFTPTNAGKWLSDGSPLAPEDLTIRVDSGLRFLHASAPQRVMQPQEFSGTPLAEFGLDPPRYSVSVYWSGGQPFTVEFGSPTPQGLDQYARVLGRHEIVLLPRFIGEQWEAVAGIR